VRCLVDHDETKLLGRTSAGTLSLRSDAKGLAFDLVVPSTTLGSDILALVERRDVQSLSFGFSVSPGGDRWPTTTTRELRSVDLSEISILHGSPAYGSTSIEARCRAANGAAAQRRLYILGMI
jgi:HK97 family phage prohead protease